MSIRQFSIEELANLAASAAAGPYVNPYSRDYVENLKSWCEVLAAYSLANQAAFTARYSHHFGEQRADLAVERRLSEIGFGPEEIIHRAPSVTKIDHWEAMTTAGLLAYNASNDSGRAIAFPDESDPIGFRTVEPGESFLNADVVRELNDLLAGLLLNARERERRAQ